MSYKNISIIIFNFVVAYLFVTLILTKSRKDKNSAKEEDSENHENDNSKLWYNILEVSSNATIDEIKRAYRDKMMQYHPDKVASLGKEFQILAEEKSKEINIAYKEALKK